MPLTTKEWARKYNYSVKHTRVMAAQGRVPATKEAKGTREVWHLEDVPVPAKGGYVTTGFRRQPFCIYVDAPTELAIREKAEAAGIKPGVYLRQWVEENICK